MSADPAVPSLDKLDAEAPILLVSVVVLWHRWSVEVIERVEEPHRRAVFGDQVLQQEEFDVPPEVVEQREKVAVLTSVSPSGLRWRGRVEQERRINLVLDLCAQGPRSVPT